MAAPDEGLDDCEGEAADAPADPADEAADEAPAAADEADDLAPPVVEALYWRALGCERKEERKGKGTHADEAAADERAADEEPAAAAVDEPAAPPAAPEADWPTHEVDEPAWTLTCSNGAVERQIRAKAGRGG